MNNLLLTAFFCLLRAASASEPVVAGGFYLNQQPISVERACVIMFHPEGLRELPSLSIVEPLSANDSELLMQAVAVEYDHILGEESGVWAKWTKALQLHQEHPALE